MKKKLKLVVSDLHIGRGRLLDSGAVNSLEEFYYAEKFVEFLGYYTADDYQQYEIELILNGDILNLLQVDFRDHYLTVITESVTVEKLKTIVSGHQQVFDKLREFAAIEGNQITYIVGNHDQGMLWAGAREFLNQVVGATVHYKNIVYYFDGIHIEHGHMHEAANRLDPKKFFLKKNLPEPILNLPFGSHFFIEFVLKIKRQYPYVDKIRPLRRMVRWSMVNETMFTIKGLSSLCFYFLKSLFFRDPRRSWPFRRVIKVLLESAVFPDLTDAARKILSDQRVHTVIFGHSHVYQYRQWKDDKEYFNTGTWTELTSLEMQSLGKITKLTYVMIEYPETSQRPRGRLKEWRGYHRIEEDVVIS